MRKYTLVTIVLLLSFVLTSCAASTPKVVKETVMATQVVKETVMATQMVKETVMATQVVKETVVQVENVVITATPLPTPEPKYNEAPMLADLVKAGNLPPVEQRLPDNPVVVPNAIETGKYGGELRFGFTGTSPEWGGMYYLAWEHPVAWKPDYSGIEPNWLESLTGNPDATVWTMKIRKGLRWSDGELFTADDIGFYIQDVLQNTELYPGGAAADWLSGNLGAGLSFAKLDDFTAILKFPSSFGTFPLILASWQGRYFCMYPKHYLQQFHKNYNPNIDQLMAKENAKTWTELFFKKGPDTWGNPGRWFTEVDLPSIYAYVVKQPMGTGTQVVLERNPYYFKVDVKGDQLPYIDKIVGVSYQDDQSRILAMLNGDVDLISGAGDNTVKAMFLEAINQGKPLQLTEVLNDQASEKSLQFNMTAKDPVKREVFSDINFRIGVSYSINRTELIDLFSDGDGRPTQVCPQPSSPLYNEQCSTQYIEYDKAKATEYLDKVFTKGKDSEGFYLDKNGKRFSFVLIVINDGATGPRDAQMGEVLVGYMRDVGLDAKMNAMPNAQFDPVRLANENEALLSDGTGGAGLDALLDARNFVTMDFTIQTHFDTAWRNWWLKGQGVAGITGYEEPPQWAKDARQKYDDALAAPTVEEQIAKMKIVIQEATDRFYMIGLYQGHAGWQPFSTRLGNLYPTGYLGWLQGSFKIMYPEQWFIKE
jgi:peptide/nickel transport system substrate-binding protein